MAPLVTFPLNKAMDFIFFGLQPIFQDGTIGHRLEIGFRLRT
jgi:hypothetical protein